MLLVEYDAHSEQGHGAYEVARVCAHLASEGHAVHVLTMEGWRLDDGLGMPGATSTTTAPRWVARLHRAGRDAGQFSQPRTRGPIGRLRRQAALGIEAFTSIAPIRNRSRALRRAGVAPDELAVVLLSGSLPFWACVISAPLDARWVLNRQRPPLPWSAPASRTLMRRVARWRDRRRHGVLRIAASTPEAAAAWQEAAPFLDVREVPAGVFVPRDPVPRPAARAALVREHGLTAGLIALALGAARPDRDYATLLGAFTRPGDDTHLIIAGPGVREWVEALVAAEPELGRARVTVLDGLVPDDEIDSLVGGVDCLVLPYSREMQGQSGLLHFAVAHRTPVVCSDACAPARWVHTSRLGVLYRGGSRASLRDALEAVRSVEVDGEGRDRYCAELSVGRFARRLVALVEDDPILE